MWGHGNEGHENIGHLCGEKGEGIGLALDISFSFLSFFFFEREGASE